LLIIKMRIVLVDWCVKLCTITSISTHALLVNYVQDKLMYPRHVAPAPFSD